MALDGKKKKDNSKFRDVLKAVLGGAGEGLQAAGRGETSVGGGIAAGVGGGLLGSVLGKKFKKKRKKKFLGNDEDEE